MKKLNIGLFGGSGKMGAQVEDVIQSSNHMPHLFVGSKKSKYFSLSIPNLQNIESEILAEVDVWIDFSSPAGLLELLEQTKDIPVVSGTTGFSTKQLGKIKSAAKKRPLFLASNFSVGLWSFRQALKALGFVKDFDITVDEIHHRNKKDMPSGTALTLQADLETIVNRKIRQPVSHRLGGVYGIHTVYAASENEIISFQHQAINRKVFASGALQAAEWLVSRKNGFYTMDDLFSKRGNK